MSPDPLLQISEDIGYIKASQDATQKDIGEMKGTLKDGHEKMNGLHTDIDNVTGTLDTHISDSEAHHKVPDNPGNKSKIKEKKWQAIIALLGIITIIVTFYFGGG